MERQNAARRGDTQAKGGGTGRVVTRGLVTRGGTVTDCVTGTREPIAPPADKKPGPIRRGQDTCRVVIIDERSFRRESILHLLREVSPECTFVALARPSDLAETTAGGGAGAGDFSDTDVIILDIGWTRLPDERIEDDIRFLKEWLGSVPIILLSDREDGPHVAEALRYGVRGFIPTSLCAAVVVEAMRLVTAGGTFIPASALVQALAGSRECHGETQGYRRSAETASLTPRECDVLNLLREGKPNKIIAAKLDLKETTVKIHVRHIMKKLKATNRTEAALMAERAR